MGPHQLETDLVCINEREVKMIAGCSGSHDPPRVWVL